jgi:RNA-binding protein Tab2/Atab2
MGIVWEIDYYSRPVLDEDGKKLWELLACESPMTTARSPESLFRYAQYCPSTTVNSAWLGQALQAAKAPAPPTKIRFFRRQMNNMIVRACQDLGLDAKISRRTIALNRWLQERMEQVYPQEETYQEVKTPTATVKYQPIAPQALPDALQGQKWTSVSLNASAFAEMSEWQIDFSEGFPLELAGLDPEASIPGIIIFSGRAFPLAAWMSGLELGFLKFDASARPRLLLETGANESWILADLVSPQTQTEAKRFEQSKQQANGVHFIAVQSDPQTQSFAGFWLLQELTLE